MIRVPNEVTQPPSEPGRHRHRPSRGHNAKKVCLASVAVDTDQAQLDFRGINFVAVGEVRECPWQGARARKVSRSANVPLADRYEDALHHSFQCRAELENHRPPSTNPSF